MTQLRAFGAVLVPYDEYRATVALLRGEVAGDLLSMVELSDQPSEAAADLIAGGPAHGLSARTTTALAGNLFGLVISALLGFVFTDWAHLSGVGSEDDFVLGAGAPGCPPW